MLQSLTFKAGRTRRRLLNFMSNHWFFGIMILAICLVLWLAEWMHPYFFLQDDNRNYFLPYFIHNYESLAAGELATYNFHQFMGIPSLAQGQSAALYPLAYLAVFFSRIIFAHSFAAIDILVIIHILIGAAGCYFLARDLELSSGIAAFSGLTWSLNSFVIFVSNSWVPVSGVAAYWPWMIALGFRQLKQPRSLWNSLAILCRLLFFYQGHVQFFIYAVIFEFLTVLLWVRLILKQNVFVIFKSYIPSYGPFLLLSMPLLLPMWDLMQNSHGRSLPLPFGNFADLYLDFFALFKNLVFPFQEYQRIIHPVHLNPTINLANIGHIGYIALLLVSIGMVYSLVTLFRTNRIHVSRLEITFLVPALFAVCWTSSLTFNYFLYQIPIINRFRWPFKVMVFFDFYLVFLAAIIFQKIVLRSSQYLSARSRLLEHKYNNRIPSILLMAVLIGQVTNLAAVYTLKPYQHFGYKQIDSIPQIEPLADTLHTGRILSFAFNEYFSDLPEGKGVSVYPSLGFNAATLTGLDYFAGYDLLVPDQTARSTFNLNHSAIVEHSNEIPVDYLRSCGVNLYLIPSAYSSFYRDNLRPYGIVPVFHDPLRTLFFDRFAQPIVSNTHGEAITDYQLTTNSIKLVSRSNREETIRFIYQFDPYFQATVDGKPWQMDRMEPVGFSISLPPGEHQIRVVYINPWFRWGLGIAFAYIVIVLLISALHTFNPYPSIKQKIN